MGLKHEAKKGTVIDVNGVKITVLRGSPRLEITAPAQCTHHCQRNPSHRTQDDG